jgi:hypothetical protein
MSPPNLSAPSCEGCRGCEQVAGRAMAAGLATIHIHDELILYRQFLLLSPDILSRLLLACEAVKVELAAFSEFKVIL